MAPPRPRPATDARPRNPARPVAGRSRRVRPAAQPHTAADPSDARRGPPRASKRPPSTPPAEPAQEQGATLPTVRRDSPTIVACVDGLRGVVSRWECSASRLGGLASFTRLNGTPARVHAATVELHRGRVEAWLRERGAEARRS